MSAEHSFKYPSLGDPKPRANEEVMLIKADNKHERGCWTDDCKAWARLHAKDRKPQRSLL